MLTTNSLIKQLNLNRHPEGGYYAETYRSDVVVSAEALPANFRDQRNICTSIYFLLPSGEASNFHRIESDELWFYHAGSSLSIYVLGEGELNVHRLGPDLANGDSLQVIVPRGSWFGALCNDVNSFTLCGCVVSPGFDFRDFTLASRQELMSDYPHHQSIILRLTKDDTIR